MDKAKGIIELDLNGNIMSKTGEFETEPEENLKKFSKNIYYILQDIHNIKNKNTTLGNFQKLTIKTGKIQYEVAIGSAVIKVFKFIKN